MTAIVHEHQGTVFHVACGSGGGARGARKAFARLGSASMTFRNIGGVDIDVGALEDFERMAGCKGTRLDLFDYDQYVAFHGRQPPVGWRQATPQDFQNAAGGETPNVVLTSMPCKGFSGLLSEMTSQSAKYQALNGLALRGVWLAMEAWADDPPEFLLFENVPRVLTRGRHLLDQIESLVSHYGYAWRETTHDCGELGGLGQSRKRFLGVGRHMAKVPPHLYEPPKRPMRGVGEILERLPLPGDTVAGGPMHRIPSLQWKTWVRLAFVEAGSDWRSLNKLRVEDGALADWGIKPERVWMDGTLGVLPWSDAAGAVTAQAEPTTGRFSVADPRVENEREGTGHLGVRAWDQYAFTVTGNGRPGSGPHTVSDPRVDGHAKSVQMGVRPWDQPSAVVKGDVSVGTGPYAVADPRIGNDGPRFSNVYRIVPWTGVSPVVSGQGGNSAGVVADPRAGAGRHVNGKFRVTAYDEPANAVISASTTGNGAFVLADVRLPWKADAHQNKMRVVDYAERAPTVTGSDRVGSGALSVADPMPRALSAADRDKYLSQGHYGVLGWRDHSGAVPAFAKNNNGYWSVADERMSISSTSEAAPKIDTLPAPSDRLIAFILARDGTWHRPFTTLDLAALQSLFDPEDVLDFRMSGTSDSQHREHIGNAIPSDTAAAIFSAMGKTLLMAWAGETFLLSNEPIWVRPLVIALSVDTGAAA